MTLGEALGITPGLTSIIGGGGKSTLLLRLGRELAKTSRVLLCTSTHMRPPAGVPLAQTPEEAAALLRERPLAAYGVFCEAGKLGQGAPMERLLPLAAYVLCEADGSKGLPLKAHAAHEPNVSRETTRLVYVAGLDGIGLPIARAAHRPALYAALLGKGQGHVLTPADVVRAILAEGYGEMGAALLLNKAEGERLAYGRQAAARWPGRAVVASLEGPQGVLEVWEHGTKQE